MTMITKRLIGLIAAALLIALPLNSIYAQSDPEFTIQELLDRLQSSDSEMEANALVQQIWYRWLHPEDQGLAEILNDAYNAYRLGDYDRSIELLTHITEEYPDYAEAWNRRATIHYETGRYEASLADIAETLKREPRHFGALAGKALVYIAMGDDIKAREAVSDAMEVHPFVAAHPPLADYVQPEIEV